MLDEFDINNEFLKLKEGIYNSKKYWLIYVIMVLFGLITQMNVANYGQPIEEIIIFILVSIIGIICIAYFTSHGNDKELHKTAFIIILTFGILLCMLTPILGTYDEVEHFVRSEITSTGVIMPEYDNGSFTTIQSTIDLIANSRATHDDGFDYIDMSKASIFKTDADTKPINYTPVKYPSAFAQNPFYGYLPQAIGIALAKLLDLNAIWLVWLGRIFNIAIYAGIASFAIKKSPILKVPLIIVGCMPLTMFISASVSIDALICGLSLLSVSYFFNMYKSPKNSIDNKNILIFSTIILILGLCKVTCFAFILLLFAVPKDNFKNRQCKLLSLISMGVLVLIALLWTKYYANPGFFMSFRTPHHIINNVNSAQQIDYILNHMNHAVVSVLRYPRYLGYFYDFAHSMVFSQLYMMFLGAMILMYPHEKFSLRSKIIVGIIGAIFYIGTLITFLLSWTPVGDVYTILGLQTRYLIPFIPLLPFMFGINHVETNKFEIDSYMIMLALAFLACDAMYLVTFAY